MARLFVCDRQARITADIEAGGSVLDDALEHEQAEAVVRCAVLMAVSALAQGDPWPGAVLQAMKAFMALMKEELGSTQMM
jgi:hypothetical protein